LYSYAGVTPILVEFEIIAARPRARRAVMLPCRAVPVERLYERNFGKGLLDPLQTRLSSTRCHIQIAEESARAVPDEQTDGPMTAGKAQVLDDENLPAVDQCV
jgi:hypothetical protein